MLDKEAVRLMKTQVLQDVRNLSHMVDKSEREHERQAQKIREGLKSISTALMKGLEEKEPVTAGE